MSRATQTSFNSIYAGKVFSVSGGVCYDYVWRYLVRLAVSIEPYLGAKISSLPQYLAEILRAKAEIKDLRLHFDYFRTDLAALALVENAAGQIPVDAHLMGQSINRQVFASVSQDVRLVRTMDEKQGLVFDLGCKVTGYEDLVRQVNFITIMSVRCGQSGQAFHPEVLSLVPVIRQLNPRATIIIDGGVNENNIKMVQAAGIDIAVVGSYAQRCYESGDLIGGLNRLLHC